MITVNGYGITEKEFDMACAEKSYAERKQLTKEDVETVAQMLIEASLMLQTAEKENIHVNDSDIDSMLNNLKANFKTEEEFIDALQKSGDDLESMKGRIERNIRLRNFVNERFVSGVKVSDEDVKKYYDAYPQYFRKGEEVRASHILFSEADKEKALEVHEMLMNGEDFAEHAKEHSICPSGQNGGDLGFFERGKMVPEFEKAAFETETDQLSDLVKTQFGYHIIKVTGKKPEGTHELAEIKESLRQSIVNSIANKKIMEFVTELKERSDINIDREKLEKRFPAE